MIFMGKSMVSGFDFPLNQSIAQVGTFHLAMASHHLQRSESKKPRKVMAFSALFTDYRLKQYDHGIGLRENRQGPQRPREVSPKICGEPLKTSKARKPMNIPHFSCWNHHIGMVKHMVNTWDTWRIIPDSIIPFLNSDFLKYGYPKSSI